MEEKMKTESSSKGDVVEMIRESLRELTSVERKEHRQNELNKNRATLGDITEASFTKEFVIEKAKAMKSKALQVEDYRRLQNSLIQSEENVNTFLNVDNVIHALVRDLSGHNPALQLCAVSCCCNIALGNNKACTSLTKSIAPYLITELESLNYPLLEVCAWTIGNLVTGSHKAFEILHAQDCMRYLISLIRNCEDAIFPSIVYATMHYVHAGFNHIPESEMVELAQAVEQRKPLYKDPYLIWLLALLSSIPTCNTYLHNAVVSAVNYLHENTVNHFSAISEVTASIRILANTVSELSGQVANMLLKNPNYTWQDLQTLLNKLLSHQYIHIRKETLWLIGNLYNHHSAEIQQTTKDILPSLSGLNQAISSLTQQFP